MCEGGFIMNEIYIEFPPVPAVPPIPKGNLALKNIKNGTEIEIQQSNSNKRFICLKENNSIQILENNLSQEGEKTRSSVIINQLDLGEYKIIVNAISDSRQPGKQYTNIFSHSESVKLRKDNQLLTIQVPEIDIASSEGREIIIYFNPFTQSPDEFYALFFEGSEEPFSKIRVAGEVHILGVNREFRGKLIIKRDGYEPATVQINPGNDKFYALANLTIPSTGEIRN